MRFGKKSTYILATLSAVSSVYFILVIVELVLGRPFPSRELGFESQFLHPYYFFSTPSDPVNLEKVNSAENWVDARGFRGPGPEAKGERKLAFLLGGSTAFGFGSSTNETSLAGALNRVQEEFFFVNAASPSWNSFQELLRFLKQVQNERPALVVDLNGFNDAVNAFTRRDSRFPADAPESYEDLAAQVEEIRNGDGVAKSLRRLTFWRPFRLEKVRGLVRQAVPSQGESYRDAGAHCEQTAGAGAKKYLENMALMHDISGLRGIDLAVFFQPFRFAPARYENVNLSEEIFGLGPDFRVCYLKFREAVRAAKTPYIEDISESFHDPAQSDRLFFDSVHFTDQGNEALAQLLWRRLRARR